MFKYRADIDGLRAIAVLSVIFFHTGIPGFGGGFVGVDVFFVISGYLITSIILKDIKSEQFSISRFYERRIRRIFPALFPVIAFTLVVATFLFDPIPFKLFGESITATTLFCSNFLFWIESGYFDADSITKPLLHTWSLAVEEQFYIFFPLLLIAINRFSKKRYLLWILGIALISFFANVYGVYTHPVGTFYLVPTRAWELLFGSLLSLEVIPELKSNVHRNIVSLTGLGFIVFSVCFYSKTTLFPGVSALIPVLGSSFIIYSGIGGTSIVKKMLSLKPMVSIGLISYSLYLWHWPLIVFSKYMIFRDLAPLEIIGIILTTFLISILSLKFIEQPFRGTTPFIYNKKHFLFFSSVVMFIFSIIGTLIYLQNGIPYRSTLIGSKILWHSFIDYKLDSKVVTTVENIPITQIGKENTIPSFIIWGDSHAMALVTGIDQKGKEYGLSGFTAYAPNFEPFVGNIINDKVFAFIKSHHKVKTVILAGIWGTVLNGHHYTNSTSDNGNKIISADSNYRNTIAFKSRLTRTVNALLSQGSMVIIVSDVPEIGFDVQRLVWIKNLLGQKIDNNNLPTIDNYRQWNKGVNGVLNELSSLPNVIIIHPESTLCVNIDVASNKEVNYGIFKSSDGRRVKKSLAA